MITVRLMGGLGNQMFQAAFGMALQARGKNVQLDKTMLTEPNREYALEFFKVFPLGLPEEPYIREIGVPFNKGMLQSPDPSTLVGYWQSEKYFTDIASEVRRVFSTTPDQSRISQDYAQQIHRSISIAVHVRRQDYVGLQHYHGMLPLSYYESAIEMIQERVLGTKVFVFSDDREWCRENFSPEYAIVDGTSKYEDLYLMTRCKHAVVANSSFSWWGAWLGDYQTERIVIAPKNWFVKEDIEERDIAPERWVKV